MHHFQYKDGVLCAEDVALSRLAEEVGTPFYCYSTATLERHYKVFAGALPAGSLVAFSVKANGNLAVLKTLAQTRRRRRRGVGRRIGQGAGRRHSGQQIVFSGVGKTRAEMRMALDAGIYQFNVESEPELAALDDVARGLGKRAPIAMRINPDVDAKTHAKITTGTAETKFGIPLDRAREAYAHAAKLRHLEIVGVDLHIGSQITDLAPFEAAFLRVVELVGVLRADGHEITRLDLGGGLGVPYENRRYGRRPIPAAYGAMVSRVTKGLGCTLSSSPAA